MLREEPIESRDGESSEGVARRASRLARCKLTSCSPVNVRWLDSDSTTTARVFTPPSWDASSARTPLSRTQPTRRRSIATVTPITLPYAISIPTEIPRCAAFPIRIPNAMRPTRGLTRLSLFLLPVSPVLILDSNKTSLIVVEVE